MKRTLKLILTSVISFCFILVCTLMFKVNAAVTTTELLTVEGAQVRTEGFAGIRFVASSTYDGTVSEYGIAVALGEVDASEIVLGASGVYSATVNELDADGRYYLTIYNVPEAAYASKITARAYVVLEDGSTVVYAETATPKSLAEISIGAKALGTEGEIITTVTEYVAANYKNSWVDTEGNVYVSNALYETNPENLKEEFIADWNTKFGTTWTDFAYLDFQASAKAGTTELTANSDADCSGTNAYEFFNTDAETSAKWKWLLEYFVANAGGRVHPIRQANALLGDGTYTDTYGNGMQQFLHLSASLANFFNGGSIRDKDNDLLFDTAKYLKVADYNTTVYSSGQHFLKIGSEAVLTNLTPATGYTFDGYSLSGTIYNDTYTVTETNAVLEPTYTAIEYTIKYMDGETELTDLAGTYTIESEKITLAGYAKEGYVFKGWYTTSTFDEGTEATELAAGSIGDRVYYAKMEESEYVSVNVSLDPDGGMWDATTLLENATILQEFTITRYLGYDSSGSVASIHNAKPATWWYYIAMTETDVAGVYEIQQIVSKNSNVTVEYDLVIMWYGSSTDACVTSLTAMYNSSSSYIGDYVILENVPEAASTSCSITVSVVDATEVTSTLSKTYQEVETLPTPVKTGYTFAGWLSSVDGTIVTEYPSYTTNPGDITYTAQWTSQTYDITYVLNGGYIRYATKDEMIADLIADFNAANGTSYATASDFPTGNYAITTVDDFYYATVDGVAMTTKWEWLMTFLYDNAVGTSNKTAFSQLLAGTEITGESYPYALSYEFRAFLQSTIYRSGNTTYGSADYSDETLANSFWSYLVEAETTYVSTGNFGAVTLPVIYHPDGVEFGGWYTSSDLSGTAVTEVSGATTLYAKWKSYNVSYELDGGFFTNYEGLTSNNYRTAVTTDLLADINTFTGKSFGLETFFANTYSTTTNYMDNFFADSTYGTKWAWLLTYINAVRAANSKATLVSGSAAAEYRGEIHNFLNGIAPGTATSNYGSDYSQDLHGYRTYLSDSIAAQYSEVLSQTSVSNLPVPVKIGGTFNGWYSDPEMTQQVIKITSDCTLYASFLMDGSGYFDITFETNSYVTVGESITINVAFTSYNGDDVTLAWKTSDENIATVVDGVVTGVAEGTATITVYVVGEESTTYESINIVVVSASQSEALALVLASHESNIFIKENLPIGSGTPAYYSDIFGSVSKLLFNDALVIDETYNTGDPDNSGSLTATEFITVHYTGNMASGADAEANASYFAQDNSVSIHYTTGNDGVFHCLDDSLWAWHAGASGGSGWNKTNVAYSSSDPKWPTFGINSSSHFTLNGQDTGITVPNETTKGYGYVTDSKWLNSQGIGWKIVDGYYYICNTEWQYKQVAEGRICNGGGNDTSIGIESCVNEGSDLWYTWQKTAQLVAKLMEENSLGI